MDPRSSLLKSHSDSMDSDDLIPPGTSPSDPFSGNPDPPLPKVVKPTPKGVENAKKRLRAFSIQKKTSIAPVVPKPLNTGTSTVLIGKLASVKSREVAKAFEDPSAEPKKPPKPPKPGAHRLQTDSYIETQKKTLFEIETMKRKMELVELGIPLGLICPEPNSDQAMPTKAMPPIKSLLDPAKVDAIIREAKKAKAEGKEFKFDYKNLLPGYENPFQRKKEEPEPKKRDGDNHKQRSRDKHRDSDKYDSRKSRDKYDRRHSGRKTPDKYKDKDKSKDRPKEKDAKTKTEKPKEEKKDEKDKKDEVEKKEVNKDKEAEVDLKDYLVCDSWSLDNDPKPKTETPKMEEKKPETPQKEIIDPMEKIKQTLLNEPAESPTNKPKMERLKPVIDSFKFEIEDDDVLDMFDENSSLETFEKVTKSRDEYSPKFDSKDTSLDEMADDTFLESVINEIKHETMDDDHSDDKGLVEYDVSPKERESITPELDARLLNSSRSDYSDGYKSVESSKSESGYKSGESGYKSTESYKSSEASYKLSDSSFKSSESHYKSSRGSIDKDYEDDKMANSTMDSLETWSFILKICQPLLFRHDKNRCYKETVTQPKLWYSECPKLCDCVKDRQVVYEELEMCKMDLVDRVYACDQLPETPAPSSRGWYRPALAAWSDEGPARAHTHTQEMSLDREYQRFMAAVWPEVEVKSETPRSTPIRHSISEQDSNEKKIKLSEGWSQESEEEEDVVKSKKQKRKRKYSSSSLSDSEIETKKAKKSLKKKEAKKLKEKAKRRRMSKKYLKKLKEKQKKKKLIVLDDDSDSDDSEKKKKSKKEKRKKLQKLKKKNAKKKKNRRRSTSSSSSDSSSDTESDFERKKKKNKNKKKKRKQSTSESTQEELFDVNILKNIKTERLTDDEKRIDFSPRKKHREIIDVKELQNDFVGKNQIQIKKEVVEQKSEENNAQDEMEVDKEARMEDSEQDSQSCDVAKDDRIEADVKSQESEDHTPILQKTSPEESSSQCSSQDSTISKDIAYEKDESHLRPSSQNSNYSFQGIMHNQHEIYHKEMDTNEHPMENYEMYEQMAMEYQSDVATQAVSPARAQCQRIETVVGARSRGEIKCDWRAGDSAPHAQQRPSRWVSATIGGLLQEDSVVSPPRTRLKPREVNIVLTGGGDQSPVAPSEEQTVYKIQSIANRTDNSNTGYDEAYMDTYGASDRLAYGDCFAQTDPDTDPDIDTDTRTNKRKHHTSLDDRIDLALKTTVLGEVAKDRDEIKEEREKGILLTKCLGRGVKRVSFADGYKPGQDSDVEEPPIKKRKKKVRRYGCSWPCPASHPDHVPLWDCLPPPAPPSDPYPPNMPPRPPYPRHAQQQQHKYDPSSAPPFMPPEPPPGIINF